MEEGGEATYPRQVFLLHAYSECKTKNVSGGSRYMFVNLFRRGFLRSQLRDQGQFNGSKFLADIPFPANTEALNQILKALRQFEDNNIPGCSLERRVYQNMSIIDNMDFRTWNAYPRKPQIL
uniref:Uncharacterized protein n=1 Tax=Tanacetum cinerariifolium TaxID=118510 RepID=A0A6L2NCE0_TANCI|nr:hypothetical protein [Tanacetum cinerariifolium]